MVRLGYPNWPDPKTKKSGILSGSDYLFVLSVDLEFADKLSFLGPTLLIILLKRLMAVDTRYTLEIIISS